MNQERARETSPPPAGSSNRVSARTNACNLVGYDGGATARHPLASKRDQLPEGNDPRAVEFKVRGLNPSLASLTVEIQADDAQKGNGSLAAPVALLFVVLDKPKRLPA